MKKILVVIILMLLVFYFFKSSLNYYFISDDFYYLSFKNLIDVFRFYPERYHYIPIFLAVLSILKKLFGLNPLPFHLLAVILHLINVGLVYYLAKKILKDDIKAVSSALIFAFFFSQYEVVFWITGIATSLMTAFYLSGLIMFIDYVRRPRLVTYFIFTFCFVLALLTHEYAITLPVACFLYVIFLGKGKIKNWLKSFSVPLMLLTFWLGLKITVFSGHQMANEPGLKQVFTSIIKSLLYLFLPNPYLIDNLPKYILVALFLLLVSVLITLSLKNKQRRFSLSWMIVSVMVFSLTSFPQARYFYLSVIPAILTVMSFLSKKKNINYLIYSYLILVLFSGLFFLQEQKKYWLEAGVITKKVLNEVKIFSAEIDKNKNVYFINLPDHFGTSIWPAYLFRVGFQEALELNYGLKPKRIYLLQTDKTIGFNQMVTSQKLNDLKKIKEVVFIYHNHINNLTLY